MFVTVSFAVPVSVLPKLSAALLPFGVGIAAPAAEPAGAESAPPAAPAQRKPRSKPAPVAEVVDDDPLGMNEAPAAAKKPPAKRVTIDEIKGAIQKRVEFAGLDSVKEVFEQFGAAKLSEIKESDYAAVLEALTAE